jgi:PAS domain S-box-containing protein
VIGQTKSVGICPRPRILLADDNAYTRQDVERLLSGSYEVQACGDGETALAAARENPPDLILADILMPRLDGFGLLRALRTEPRTGDIPVILLSASAGAESQAEALEAGADDYLIRPFGARELLARVSARLEITRLHRVALEREHKLRKSAEDAEAQLTRKNIELRRARNTLQRALSSQNEDLSELAEDLVASGQALLALKDELATELAAMTRLHDLGTRLLATTDLQPLLEEVLDATMALQNADLGSVQLYNPTIQMLEIVAHRGLRQGFLDEFGSMRDDSSICGRALLQRQRVIVEDVLSDPDCEPHRAMALAAGYRSVQSTPLFSRSGEPLGMISTYFLESHQPSERELRLADLYARQAADMIERKRAEEALRQAHAESEIRVDERTLELSTANSLLRQEIAERKRAEESLRQAQARTESVLTSVADVHVLFDRQWRCIYVNQAAIRAMGRPRDQILGRTLWELYPDIIGTELDRQFRRAMDERVAVSLEFYYASLDSWWANHFYPAPEGLAVFATEITERKRAEDALAQMHNELERRVIDRTRLLTAANEELKNQIAERKRAEDLLRASERRFRSLIDAMPHHVWSFRPDGSVGYWNHRVLDYTGLTPEELQQGGWAALHPGDVERVRAAWREAWSQGTSYQVEQRIRGRDGRYRRFLCRAEPVCDERGQLIEWFGTDTDVEERRQAEELLQRAQAELTRVTHKTTMGELAASIAHEINQPLGAIVNNGNVCLRLLGNAPSQKDARDALSDIVRDANRASTIIAHIRALTGRSTLEKTSLRVKDVFLDVLTLAQRELAEGRITVRVEMAEDLPRVSGDRVQLQQVFLNLVMNGIEAMHALSDERRIMTIGGQPGQLDGKPAVLINVQDLGPGFKPEDSECLFDAFYTTKPNGLGMGLRISRSIVEAHGGWLWATSGAGGGAEFHCVLPTEDRTTRG